MATDAFVQLDGIRGESSDADHKGFIEIIKLNLGVIQPISPIKSTSGGLTTSRCEHSPVSFLKLTDLSTPKLLELCSMGSVLKSAKIDFCRADGDKKLSFFKIDLEDVVIASCFPAFENSEIGLVETVTLVYAKVMWVYSQQKISGGAGGNVMGGWDLQHNRRYIGLR